MEGEKEEVESRLRGGGGEGEKEIGEGGEEVVGE